MAVSRALKKLEYTTKITSTVAYQAFTTRNLARRQMLWTEPWPVGMHGVPRRTMVDIYEFGLHLNAANKERGSSPRGLEIRKPVDCGGLARRWSEVSDLQTMQTLVEELIDVGILGMDATFVKCGYIWN